MGLKLAKDGVKKQDDPREVEARNLIRSFEKQISVQEDIVYGLALFFEGLNLLYAGQQDVIETYRKQFRNLIQNGQNAIDQAKALLEQVRSSPRKASQLKEFEFSPCEGHPNPLEMVKRARMLAKTYDEIFPGRPRSDPFTESETFRLMETASERLG